jgi:hypothetical protein
MPTGSAKKIMNFKLMLILTSAALFLDAVLPVLPFPHLNMYTVLN